MTLQESIDLLAAVPGVLDNISADGDKQANMIKDLQAIIAAGGSVTEQQLQQIADLAVRIKGQADSVDAKVS